MKTTFPSFKSRFNNSADDTNNDGDLSDSFLFIFVLKTSKKPGVFYYFLGGIKGGEWHETE